MNKVEILLYAIILGLVVNLLADMIWKYLPGSNRHLDKLITFHRIEWWRGSQLIKSLQT